MGGSSRWSDYISLTGTVRNFSSENAVVVRNSRGTKNTCFSHARSVRRRSHAVSQIRTLFSTGFSHAPERPPEPSRHRLQAADLHRATTYLRTKAATRVTSTLRRGRPNCSPFARAAAMPERTRSRISSRSNSATFAQTRRDAERTPFLVFLQTEPDFDFVHDTDRYRAIVKRIGLPINH